MVLITSVQKPFIGTEASHGQHIGLIPRRSRFMERQGHINSGLDLVILVLWCLTLRVIKNINLLWQMKSSPQEPLYLYSNILMTLLYTMISQTRNNRKRPQPVQLTGCGLYVQTIFQGVSS